MDDAKINNILGGSVEDGKGKLAGLSRADLEQLHEHEEKNQKRTTMLAAIDGAIKASGDDGSNGNGGETARSDAGAVTYTQAQVDKMLDDQRKGHEGMFTQADLDEALAAQKITLDAEKVRAVAEASGVAGATVTPRVPGVLVMGGQPPRLDTALTEATYVVFVDDQDRPLADLPPMMFDPNKFEPTGEAMALKEEIDFPKTIAPNDVSGAFLLDDEEEPIGKATLVMPFAVGGGRNAKLARSTLLFAQ